MCNDLPPVAVSDLQLHPVKNDLVIGTHGRSAFVLDVSPIRNYKNFTQQGKNQLLPVESARLPRERHARNDWDLETLRKARFTIYLPEKENIKLIVSDMNEHKVWQYENDFTKGFHIIEWDMIKQASHFMKSAYFNGTEFYEEGQYKVKFQLGAEVIEDILIVKDFK